MYRRGWSASTFIPLLLVLGACAASHRKTPATSPAIPAPSIAASSSAASPSIGCSQQLRTTFAFAARPDPVTVHADVAGGFTKCDYRTGAGSTGTCTAASVTINTSPQAFTDFNRWVVETAQNANAGPGTGLAPMQINGIGVLAAWVPGRLTFEATTQTRWIAVYLTCATPATKDLALAEALGRAAIAAS